MRTLFVLPVLALPVTAVGVQPPATSADGPRITVGGEATVYVQPDRVVVGLGIETWDEDLQTARQQNDRILEQTLDALQGCGLPDEAVETDQIAVCPWRRGYWHDEGDARYRGFVARRTIVVTLKRPEKLPELVTAALSAGVNVVHKVVFQTAELKKHREQARKLALLAARNKAELMAAVLGRSVGRPLTITEERRDPEASHWSSWSWRAPPPVGSQREPQACGEAGDTSETPGLGKLAIRAGVSVTFELTD